MDFYGIEMRGPFILEILTSKPDFEVGDTGRLIYVSEEQMLYFGGLTEWIAGGETLGATLAELNAETEEKKFITPLLYSQIKASISDVISGIDNIKRITPYALRGLKASIEESKIGTDDIKYVTPAGLKSFAADNPGIIPGTVIYYTKNTAPSGYLKANGAAISRTTYSNLFDVIGTSFGSGDGTTTFNLPDLRGEFIRSWDDGRDVDVGRVFGSWQEDAVRKMTGMIYGFTGWVSPSGTGPFRVSIGSRSGGQSGTSFAHGSMSFDNSLVVPTAEENRPRNIALLACIKY